MAKQAPTMRSAGCVVWRDGGHEPEVVVVHRPRYDDWSFPKGKLERGERPLVAAAREVAEETGLRVRIGPRLRDDHYPLQTGQAKVVSYWVARPPADADLTRYEPNAEVDQVTWMSLSKARKRLTYPRDVDLLEEFTVSAFDSSSLLVVRHAEARNRRTWKHHDNERPLAADGRRQADRLLPILAAYGVTRVITSDAVRCVDTVLPFVNAYQVKLRLEPALSEAGMSDRALAKLARKALESKKRMVICTHRLVLPRLLRALGIAEEQIEPGEMIVVHRRKGKVLSTEKPG
jgi:8-oxo-dGTP diphosphatase